MTPVYRWMGASTKGAVLAVARKRGRGWYRGGLRLIQRGGLASATSSAFCSRLNRPLKCWLALQWLHLQLVFSQYSKMVHWNYWNFFANLIRRFRLVFGQIYHHITMIVFCSYCGMHTWNLTQAFEWYHFEWPWVTSNPDFKVRFQCQITWKWYKIELYLQWPTDK